MEAAQKFSAYEELLRVYKKYEPYINTIRSNGSLMAGNVRSMSAST